MTYKTLCSDLDGTLLSTKNDVSDFSITEISRIKDKINVVLVSARMPKSMTYLQKRLGIENQPIICYNGALVLDGIKEIDSIYISVENLYKIYELAEKHTIKLGLYFNDEWYVEETSERVEKEIRYTHATPVFRNTKDTLEDWKNRNVGAHKIMMMCTKESADAIYPILQEILGEQVNLYRSNDTLIEVAPKTVSKLSAIKLLLQKDNVEDVIAFGDNYNDIAMLQHVGCGVAVGNAREEVKAIADAITLNNTEHGVAHYIKEHL